MGERATKVTPVSTRGEAMITGGRWPSALLLSMILPLAAQQPAPVQSRFPTDANLLDVRSFGAKGDGIDSTLVGTFVEEAFAPIAPTASTPSSPETVGSKTYPAPPFQPVKAPAAGASFRCSLSPLSPRQAR